MALHLVVFKCGVINHLTLQNYLLRCYTVVLRLFSWCICDLLDFKISFTRHKLISLIDFQAKLICSTLVGIMTGAPVSFMDIITKLNMASQKIEGSDAMCFVCISHGE